MKFARLVLMTVALGGTVSLMAETGDRTWPKGTDPREIGRRIVRQFLSTEPENYKPKGFTGSYGGGKYVCYSVASLWVNALEFAQLTGDKALQADLVGRFRPFLPGGAKADKVTKPRHVDFNVFGSVPLEVALLTGDKAAQQMGLRYADDQWEPPRPDDTDAMPNWLKSHYTPVEKQLAYLREGYSGQTRLWIDDMYMINVLQTQAYRVTGDAKYIRRAAKEMVLYLDRLQLENGLFNHAADVPFRWARGNGWMAAGMPMILQYLKPGEAHYDRILAGYRKMMATLLATQRPSGLWGQLVDDADSWDETSGSLMFAYGFLMGCRHGWLEKAGYLPAARRAYLAVAQSLDEYGNVPGVCIGTGAKNDRQYYYDREKINGDPHGQAPLLWCVNELIRNAAEVAVAFPLEWNSTYRTDVPYEVEVNPAKLGAETFAVKADGVTLETAIFAGKRPGTVALRFTVPAGTKALSCVGTEGRPTCADVASIDNLFKGALAAENIGKWSLPKGVKAELTAQGLVFRADKTAPAQAYVSYAIDLPEGVGGQPVMQEIEVANQSRLVWGGTTRIEQLDADGKLLPETLADCRWTTHMRPPQKVCTYRDEGHFHPKARKLRFVAELRRTKAEFDDYGRPLADKSMLLPALSLTRLAVRPAAQLPFPKWNDGFFGTGVSGQAGDASFVMGGAEGHAFFYQLRSRASWTQAHQFRKEEDLYFPSRDGTVEAWLKPDFSTNPKVVIFEAYQNYLAEELKKGMGPVLRLGYDAKAKKLALLMRDWTGRLYEQTFDGVTVPEGQWTHVALQWSIGGKTEAFVDGRLVATMPIPDFQAVAIDDPKEKGPNDRWAMELFFGADCANARLAEGKPKGAGGTFLDGEADNLRVSTGCRYRDGFTPAKAFAMDADTRALFTFDRTFDGESSGGFGFIPGSVRATVDRVDHQMKVTQSNNRTPSAIEQSNNQTPSTIEQSNNRTPPAIEQSNNQTSPTIEQSNNQTSPAIEQSNNQTIEQFSIWYYPKEILPENDPAKVLDIVNYPVMPSERDYRVARRLCAKTATVRPGERLSVTAGAEARPAFVSYENLSKDQPLKYPILVRDGALDPRSFGDLCDSLTAAGGTDRERVNRMFQYVINASDYFMNHQACFKPGSDEPVTACYEAMITLNSYCGFECGPLNNMTANMLATVAKCPAGQTRGYGHEFQQVFFDGKNHVYDLSAQKFFPAMDNETSAYLKEIGDQPIVNRRVGGCVDHFMRRGTRPCFVFDPSYQEKVAMTLNPGEKLTVWFANDAQMNNLQTRSKTGVYGWKELGFEMVDYAKAAGADDSKSWTARKDRIFPQYSTSVVTFDGVPSRANPAFGAFGPASFVYRVTSCYPIVFAEYAAQLKNGRTAALEISTDLGKTFRPLPAGKDGVSRLEYLVKARHAYFVRVKAPLETVARFTARTEGEVNPRTYPGWVKPGENAFTFKAEPGGAARVSVGWREPAKEIVVSGTARSGAIPGCERELVVVDPAKPLVLDVSGASPKAEVRTYGRVKASLKDGRLTLAYDAAKRQAIGRGDDNPETRNEFPTVAGVDIVDGDAVKTVTAIVSPNARLVVAKDAAISTGKKPFAYEKLPAGRYGVFALARFASHGGGSVVFDDPADPAKSHVIARSIDGFMDYLKAQYGRPGERSRWKWDTEIRQDVQHWASGFSMKLFDLPETDHLDLHTRWYSKTEPAECQALLILPDPDFEARLDLRKILFGLNCDPFHVQ